MKTTMPNRTRNHRTLPRQKLSAIAVAALLMGAALHMNAADANPPARMSFQSFVVDANGVPLGNTTVANFDVVFRIYNASQGGATTWAELQTVTVDKGNFSVVLGEGSTSGSEPHGSLDAVFGGVDASDRYIGITVKGLPGAETEISPRMRLLPAPYSFMAKNALALTAAGGQPLYNFVGGAIQSVGGALRGNSAVDLQTTRADAGQVAAGNYSVIGGGQNNRAGGLQSSVVGGNKNLASGDNSFIGGGLENTASGITASIVGGFKNRAAATDSFIGAGGENFAEGYRSVIGGGGFNHTLNDHSTVGGGYGNSAIGLNAFVGGGAENMANGTTAIIAGGFRNHSTGLESYIGGGVVNTNTALRGTIGGGLFNRVTAEYGVIAGGLNNLASGPASGIVGGDGNQASGTQSTIGGGLINVASGLRSTVAGGVDNQATGDHSTVLGGHFNRATGLNSATLGGYNNLAQGVHSLAAGRRAKAIHNGSFVWADDQDADFTTTTSQQVIFRAGGGFGINTPNPDGPFHVATRPNNLKVANNFVMIRLEAKTINKIWNIGIDDQASDPDLVFMSGNTEVGWIEPDGSGFRTPRDRRLKKDIEPLEGGVLERISRLPVVKFHMLDDAATARKQIGVIAQDLQEVYPELVDNHSGKLGVGYDRLGVLAVAAVKEVKAEKDAEIQELKRQMAEMKEMLDQMRNAQPKLVQ